VHKSCSEIARSTGESLGVPCRHLSPLLVSEARVLERKLQFRKVPVRAQERNKRIFDHFTQSQRLLMHTKHVVCIPRATFLCSSPEVDGLLRLGEAEGTLAQLSWRPDLCFLSPTRARILWRTACVLETLASCDQLTSG
jgi:hypothetical protein